MWCCGWSEGPWICWNYDWISSLWFMNFHRDSWNCCAVYSSRVCDSPPHKTVSWHRQDVLMPQRVGMLIVGEILQEIHIFHHSISPSRDNSRRVSAAATFTPKKHKFSASVWADKKSFSALVLKQQIFAAPRGRSFPSVTVWNKKPPKHLKQYIIISRTSLNYYWRIVHVLLQQSLFFFIFHIFLPFLILFILLRRCCRAAVVPHWSMKWTKLQFVDSNELELPKPNEMKKLESRIIYLFIIFLDKFLWHLKSSPFFFVRESVRPDLNHPNCFTASLCVHVDSRLASDDRVEF